MRDRERDIYRGRGGGRYTVTRAIYEKEVEKWRLVSLRKVIN